MVGKNFSLVSDTEIPDLIQTASAPLLGATELPAGDGRKRSSLDRYNHRRSRTRSGSMEEDRRLSSRLNWGLPTEIKTKRYSFRVGGSSQRSGQASGDVPTSAGVASLGNQRSVFHGQGFRLLKKLPGDSLQQHKLNIHRIHHISSVYFLYAIDLFHTLVNLRLKYLVTIFGTIYVFCFSTLAWAFWSLNDTCEMEMTSYLEAFAFSVETWLTIGYGAPDKRGPFFRDCWQAIAVVTTQGVIGLILNALLVGLIITHVSSGSKRGCTLIFSKKACIREVAGRLYFIMQVCEMRKTQLLEAHVRAYVIRKPAGPCEMPAQVPQAFEMRFSRPDDEIGAWIFPVLPTYLVHEIDGFSPLAPPSPEDPMRTRHWTRPQLRSVENRTGSRSSLWCRTCGTDFPTLEMLEAHSAYMAEQDRLSGVELRHHPLPKPAEGSARSWRSRVEKFLNQDWFEVVCILEGVDTTTSATVQARHSYIYEDIAWDHMFSPIFSIDPTHEDGAVIDFTKIHDLQPAYPQRTE